MRRMQRQSIKNENPNSNKRYIVATISMESDKIRVDEF